MIERFYRMHTGLGLIPLHEWATAIARSTRNARTLFECAASRPLVVTSGSEERGVLGPFPTSHSGPHSLNPHTKMPLVREIAWSFPAKVKNSEISNISI